MMEESSRGFDPISKPRSRNSDFLIYCYKGCKMFWLKDDADLVNITNCHTGEGDLLQAGTRRVNCDVNTTADEIFCDNADRTHGNNLRQYLG